MGWTELVEKYDFWKFLSDLRRLLEYNKLTCLGANLFFPIVLANISKEVVYGLYGTCRVIRILKNSFRSTQFVRIQKIICLGVIVFPIFLAHISKNAVNGLNGTCRALRSFENCVRIYAAWSDSEKKTSWSFSYVLLFWHAENKFFPLTTQGWPTVCVRCMLGSLSQTTTPTSGGWLSLTVCPDCITDVQKWMDGRPRSCSPHHLRVKSHLGV